MTINCGGCGATWTGMRTCHCAGCHRSFSGLALFDAHRSQYGDRGGCADPVTLIVRTGPRTGEPIMYLRDGVWSGPEMDEATKAARFGERGAA